MELAFTINEALFRKAAVELVNVNAYTALAALVAVKFKLLAVSV